MFKIKKITALVLFAATLPLFGLGCKGGGEIPEDSITPVTLSYWRVFDEPSDFSSVIAAFKQQHPHISVQVKKLRFEEYEDELIRALAEGKGPDIISIHSTWVRGYQDLLATMPASVALPTASYSGDKITTTLQSFRMLTPADLRNFYIDTVAKDAVVNSNIYGLPLSVDNLVLYYNRDMMTQANIATPPATWDEFKEQVKKLSIQNRNGDIIQAGVAMGGARNINRAPDMLALLMMQNGTEMTSSDNAQVTFNQVPEALKSKQIAPGRDALRFYTDFASPSKEVYTWNETMPEALNSFTSQKTAFFFGYAYHLPLIQSLAPGIDFGVAPAPQISAEGRKINIANYWLEGVSKRSGHQDEAWAFVKFAATQPGVEKFLEASRKPTALRSLIGTQRQKEPLAIFADQLLTSESWYRGNDAAAAEEAMRVMIEQVAAGTKDPDTAINEAAAAVNRTY